MRDRFDFGHRYVSRILGAPVGNPESGISGFKAGDGELPSGGLQPATARRESRGVEAKAAAVAYGIVILAWFLLLVLTRSLFAGDTAWFVDDILGFLHRDPAVWAHMADFGHIAWRPVGWLLSAAVLHIFALPYPEVVVIAGVLEAVNIAATLVCAVALTTWGLRVTGSPFAAGAAAICFLWTTTILDASRSGSPWIPGLAFLLLACATASSSRALWISGLLAGISVLFWMPYFLTVPAVLAVRLLSPGGPKGKAAIRPALRFVGAAALVVVAGYAVAAAARGVNSWGALAGWIREASHGDVRNGLVARFFFGLPRSILDFADEGIMLKRFVYHDPYSVVNLADIARLGLLKLAPFYAAALLVLVSVYRSVRGRYLALVLLVAAIPNLALALAFDSSSMERYLALFPFLFLCLAWFLREANRTSVLIVCAFCALLMINNLRDLSAGHVKAILGAEAGRTAALAAYTKPADLVYVLNAQDAIVRVRYADPFDLNARRLPGLAGIQPFLGRPGTWRERVRSAVLAAWQQHADVWVTVRVRAARPEASWNWAEGSVPGISWQSIQTAFEHLQFGGVIGGRDGFALLPPTEGNREALQALAGDSRPLADLEGH